MEFYGWILGEGFILMCWPGSYKKEAERRDEGAELFSLNSGEFFSFWPESCTLERPPALAERYVRNCQVLFN